MPSGVEVYILDQPSIGDACRFSVSPLYDRRVLEIRNADPSDLSSVAEIHVASWQAAYRGIISDEILDSLSVKERQQTWKEWIRLPGSELFVASRGEMILGFCRLVHPDYSDDADQYVELTHLYLDPDAYGSGVGYALLQRAIKAAKARGSKGLFLWVLEENDRARRFYERANMRFDGGRQSRPVWLGEGVFEVRYRSSFVSAV